MGYWYYDFNDDDHVLSRLVRRSSPRARKQHFCSDCHDPIEPGARYIVEFWIVDGEPHYVKRHGACEYGY